MDFNSLYKSVEKLDAAFEDNTAKAINKNVTARNWLIGFYIVHYEQKGKDRAQYGEKTLQKLSEKLNKRSLSYRNLRLYRQFYLEFIMLEKPIYNYVINEFASEETLLINIKDNLIEDTTLTKDLAISDCQIGQTVIAQSDAPQIPPERLFTHLSFTHFTLIMSVENQLALPKESELTEWLKKEVKNLSKDTYEI